jgi:hypothetical protein
MTKKPEVRLTKYYQPHFQLGLTHNLSWVWLISRKLQSNNHPLPNFFGLGKKYLSQG